MPPCDLLSPSLSGQYCLSTHTRPYAFNECLFCIQAYSALFCTPIYGLSARSTPSQYSQLHILHWFWSLILTPSSYLVPTPHGSIFPNRIPISHTSQLTTHATHIASIYGIRMSSQHSKQTSIHSNTISKFTPRYHYVEKISPFR